ncbi:MAG: hypothetical protein FJZ09_01545 [Candidatus Omnitrophica bacterium]|nr:hypothetical protein [Candidatus Omnitrophota bacterium]
MKRKGLLLVILGVIGALYVYFFDLLMGKPMNDVTGPKSVVAFVICGILVLAGLRIAFGCPVCRVKDKK